MRDVLDLEIHKEAVRKFSHYKMQLSNAKELREEFKEVWERLKREQRIATIKEVIFQSSLLAVFIYLFVNVISGV